ncbi:hypothetical protein ACN27G_21605 [Plantactinospora sp. WMMB334]|uniref:hypothetical protein n=1 Tax=Plantactinospora sp. WMMB334 TaxID=3404119 RepID=UPI003B9442EF
MIRATAAAFAEPTLRSLDAIHLATAQVLTNESGAALTAFVTYDRRLLECAKEAGLPVASPGQNIDHGLRFCHLAPLRLGIRFGWGRRVAARTAHHCRRSPAAGRFDQVTGSEQ